MKNQKLLLIPALLAGFLFAGNAQAQTELQLTEEEEILLSEICEILCDEEDEEDKEIKTPPKQAPPTTTQTTLQPPENTSPQTTASSYQTGAVVITRLLPNPEGSDTTGEWIELQNIDTASIDLDGWTLQDLKTSHALAPHILTPNETLTLPRPETKIALNNTGTETLELRDPAGNLIHSLTYEGPTPEGIPIEKNAEGNYVWALPVQQEEPKPIQPPTAIQTTIAPPPPSTPKPVQKNTPQPTPTLDPQPTQPTKNTVTQPQQQKSIPPPPPPPFIQIYISELLPNPSGSDTEGEWIELFNPGRQAVALSGWQLDDEEGGSRPYTFPAGTTIYPEEFLIIDRPTSKLALNNTSDSVRLFDTESRLVHEVVYTGSKEQLSYAYIIGSDWSWTEIATPQEPNELPPSPLDQPAPQVLGATTKAQDQKQPKEKPAAIEIPPGDEPQNNTLSYLLLLAGVLLLTIITLYAKQHYLNRRYTS